MNGLYAPQKPQGSKLSINGQAITKGEKMFWNLKSVQIFGTT